MVREESFLSSLREGERVSLLKEPLGGQIKRREVAAGTWSTGKWSRKVPRHVTWSVGGEEQVHPLGQGEGGRGGEEGTV